MFTAFVIYPLIALIAAIAADRMADKRNRHRLFWMSASLLFPPMAILLYALKVRPPEKRPRYDHHDDDDLRDFMRD